MSSEQKIAINKAENTAVSSATTHPVDTLTQVCIDGKFDDLKKRIEQGENIQEKDSDGNHLTHTAGRVGKLEILNWLVLEKTMNVNEVNAANETVFRVALKAKQLDVVEWLIEKRKQINLEVTINDLFKGIKTGDLDIVKAIVKVTDVCEENAQGKTAIELAREKNEKDIERFLCKKVALNILTNKKKEEEKLDMLKRHLSDQDTDCFNKTIKHKDDKKTIIEMAREKQYMLIVKWMEDKRAGVENKITSSEATPNKIKEYNILIIGETGVGKSTFINAFANYINFNSLDESERSDEIYCLIPTSFTITDDNFERRVITFGQDDNESFASGQSSTQSARSYSIKTDTAIVRLIDTPGIGDTRGIEKDQENFDKLLKVIAELENIHAICIMLKPNNARLNVLFEYCIKGIFSNLDKSASQNIVFLFTNARGTFYRPGDTVTSLLRVLKELEAEPTNVKIPFNKDNVFCMDNESFRFLLAKRQNVIFTDEEKQNFSGSWDKSSQVCRSLIEYIVKLKPHNIQNTVTINAAKRLVLTLSKPLADVAQYISKTAAYLEQKKDQFERNKEDIEEFKKHLHFEVLVPQIKRLEHPVTMCQNKKCTTYHKLSNNEVHSEYKICHDECYLEKITPDVKGHSSIMKCRVIHWDCEICKHSYLDHIHRYYTTELVKETITNLKFDFDIKTLDKAKIDDSIRQLEKVKDEFKTQEDTILRGMSKFSHFLKHNSIIVYQDICRSHIQNLIEEERSLDQLTDTNRLNTYQGMLNKYDNYYNALEQKYTETGKTGVTASEIFDEINKLYELRMNGNTIREFSEAQMEQQKKEILPDTQVVPKNNTFANFLSSIK